MIKKNLFKIIENLETIEEKSFWVIAPTVILMGLIALTTSGAYGSIVPTIISAILCLIIPAVLMLLVRKYHNYHWAYPMLCIFVGAVSIPITFIFAGGFLSGMPLFCVVSTCICALCYSRKWRYIALLMDFLGNSAAFVYVYYFGTPFPLDGNVAIYNDIVFSYFFASIAAFIAISLIIVEVRKYRISQDVLNTYFDTRVRKEIVDKALRGDLALSTGHRKAVIAFIDISNFTTITEKMDSDLIAQFLNEFFSIAGKHIHKSDGVIDKYIGDCIMSYWFDDGNHNCVYDAVKAVVDIKKEVMEKSEGFYEKYGTELNFSTGISYGDIIFGDIGSDTMHDYTIIGDAVNTASRIEDYAVAGELLISENAASMVKDYFELELVERDIYFKGKHNSIDLYRVKSEENRVINISNKKSLLGYSLHVCGCRGSFPVSGMRFSEYGGETSCYVLKKDDYAIIVDCGTGLKNAEDLVVGCKKIDILLTHVHYDHILGLLMSQPPKDVDFTIYGHFNGWKDTTNTLNNFMEEPYWPVGMANIENINVELGESFVIHDDIEVTFYHSDHPNEGCVIKIMCKDKKICFFADCENAELLDESISKDADILFYDGMFDDNDTVDHKGWGHGTWQSGLRFAKAQNIKKLVITHHNPAIGDHTLHMRETDARAIANNVSFAKTGDTYLL